MFREELHDARATTIRGTVVLLPEPVLAVTKHQDVRHTSGPAFQQMRIRIVKHPPAPLMDGFDVRGLDVGYVYDVDARTGHYLIVAGYAVAIAHDEPEPPKQGQSR